LRKYFRHHRAPKRSLPAFLDWLKKHGEFSALSTPPLIAKYSAEWAESKLNLLLKSNRRIQISAQRRPSLLADFARVIGEEGGVPFVLKEVESIAKNFLPRARPDCGMEYLRERSVPAKQERAIGVVTHSRGNSFFLDIQMLLTAAFRRAGMRAFSCDQKAVPDLKKSLYLVVAPHEFFSLPGTRDEWFRESGRFVLVNTEQPSSRWFSSSMPVVFKSPLVLDINWQSCMILRLLGVNAYFLPLGFITGFRPFAPRSVLPNKLAFAHLARSEPQVGRPIPEFSARPIDVLFVGSLSPRREVLFAQAASALSNYSCFLHFLSEQRPLLRGEPQCMDSRDMADLCSRSKILLNIHRDELPYFEWQRIVLNGIWHGTLIVSESTLPAPGFRAGIDYLECEPSGLPALLHHLLQTPSGRTEAERITARARRKLQRQFDMRQIALRCARLFYDGILD
jgi:hypothetical protein